MIPACSKHHNLLLSPVDFQRAFICLDRAEVTIGQTSSDDALHMKLYKLTSLARILDPRDPANVAIAVLTLLVMLGGLFIGRWSGASWLVSVASSLQAGLVVFFSWALCRELDPDHSGSALAAAGLALVSLLFWEGANLLLILWLLLTLRVVIRTTGLPATLLDGLGVMLLAAWQVYLGNWIPGVLTAAAFLLDARLFPALSRQAWLAGLALLFTAAGIILQGHFWPADGLAWIDGLAAIGFSLVFIPVLLGSRQVGSAGDATGEKLQPARLLSGQGIALVAGIGIALLYGAVGLAALQALWVAVLAAGVYRLVVIARQRLAA